MFFSSLIQATDSDGDTAHLDAGFTVVIDDDTLDQLGRGLNSARPLLIHGPSGAGKTTLVKILSTLLKSDAGAAETTTKADVKCRSSSGSWLTTP